MTSHDIIIGLGLLEDNDIYGNTLSGVWIKTDANPVLRRNKIYDGKESEVCVFSNGRGLLEDNEIFNNLLSGECAPLLLVMSLNNYPVTYHTRSVHWVGISTVDKLSI